MLELSADTTTCVDFDFDRDLRLYLDKLVREAEAELGNASTTHLPNASAASHLVRSPPPTSANKPINSTVLL
ncbi:hypothetical protein ZWY2020_001195 [Hordeum vulgare]|nr:hypothetical protein ZWY2020_001195 [Hordeum vulgare]